jgi:hypothetical protein
MNLIDSSYKSIEFNFITYTRFLNLRSNYKVS